MALLEEMRKKINRSTKGSKEAKKYKRLYKEKNREITHLRQEVTLLRNSSDPLLKEKIDKLVH